LRYKEENIFKEKNNKIDESEDSIEIEKRMILCMQQTSELFFNLLRVRVRLRAGVRVGVH
jgi:hypothetical protein